jgi:hypothetical protein
MTKKREKRDSVKDSKVERKTVMKRILPVNKSPKVVAVSFYSAISKLLNSLCPCT